MKPASTAELCVPPKDNILIASHYPVKDFAVRAGSPGSYTYRPLNVQVAVQAGQYCTKIQANGWYCPIARTAGYATATADTGTHSCEALDALTARAQLQQQCTAGDAAACRKIGMPAPPPATKVTQKVSFANLASGDWTGVVKQVYEVAYGSVLGIYDLNLKRYNTGCGVSSSVDTRRSITVTYSATVHHTYAQTASTASQSLQANPGALVNAVTQAKASIGAAAASVAVPSASDITAQAPTITGGIAQSSSDDLGGLIFLAGVVLLCCCCCGAALACWTMAGGSNSSVSTKSMTDMEMQQNPVRQIGTLPN